MLLTPYPLGGAEGRFEGCLSPTTQPLTPAPLPRWGEGRTVTRDRLNPYKAPRHGVVARGFIPRGFLRGAQGPAPRRVSLVAARGYVHCRVPGSVLELPLTRDIFDFPA